MSAPSPSSLPADDLEPVPFCEACGAPAESARYIFHREGLAFRRCARCGLVFVAPRLSRDALWRRYGDEYIPQHGPFSDESNDEHFAARLRDLDRLRPAPNSQNLYAEAAGPEPGARRREAGIRCVPYSEPPLRRARRAWDFRSLPFYMHRNNKLPEPVRARPAG